MNGLSALDLEGRSEHARRLRMLARILGRSRSPVVIQGELGVGKSRFARWVHELSEGASRTYRRVPCQVEGIDLTSILNDVAGGGTVVFEHVDEAPRGLQKGMTRLLAGKLCEAGRVRVLATSRRDLAVEVLEGRVSPDLYFRLRVQCVEIPPLRERKEDIAVLARSILEELARSRGGPVPELTGDALEAAELYTWPGNVRQLRSELQRCAAIVHHAIGKRLLTEGLDGRLPVRTIHAPLTGRSLGERVAAAERQAIEEALAVTGGHRDRAAALLGITRRTLQRKLAEARGAGRRLDDPCAPEAAEPGSGDVKLEAEPKPSEELDSDGEGGVPCLV